MLGDNDLCMKSNNCISEKINEYRSEVETMIQGFQRQILEQEHKIEELKNSKKESLIHCSRICCLLLMLMKRLRLV